MKSRERRCIAFREIHVLKAVAFTPCQQPSKKGKRFCADHLRMYRELLIGILNSRDK